MPGIYPGSGEKIGYFPTLEAEDGVAARVVLIEWCAVEVLDVVGVEVVAGVEERLVDGDLFLGGDDLAVLCGEGIALGDVEAVDAEDGEEGVVHPVGEFGEVGGVDLLEHLFVDLSLGE